MAYTILDTCTNCAKCLEECPTSAIQQGDDKCSIDAGACIDCGACLDCCETESIVEA